MKQKHAELIKAWADGAEIEKRQIYCKYQMNEEPIIVSEEWLPCHSPTWAWNEEYRIKPEPKAEPKKVTMYIYNNPLQGATWIDEVHPKQRVESLYSVYIGSIEVTK